MFVVIVAPRRIVGATRLSLTFVFKYSGIGKYYKAQIIGNFLKFGRENIVSKLSTKC